MNGWQVIAHIRHSRPVITRFLLLIPILFGLIGPYSIAAGQMGDVGYRDFAFPKRTGGNSEPTGEKPESKLWWHDGFWFGSMWSITGNAYHIHRLNLDTQTWEDTGTAIDDRNDSRADALWDGSKLYIVSHVFIDNAGQPAPPGQRGELYRYSYQPATQTFALDPDFPVEVTEGKSETLVLEKDSSGQLWVTYVENQRVMLNHSLNGDDRLWGKPFVLPAGGSENVAADDISSIIAYNQHIGVMWSNQLSPKTMYFAVHPVGAPDSVWTRVRAFSISADDHINLKSLQTDSAGNVFSVVKTSTSSQLIMVLVCKNNINRCKTESDWISYPVYNSSAYNPTRPMLLIDETNRHLYVFTRNQEIDRLGGIYYKRADLDNISFPTGIGTAFIRNSVDTEINDPSSTKQNLNAQTGLVILASDTRTKYYLHNYMSLGASPIPSPTIHAFTPSSGAEGTVVTLTGSGYSQAQTVTFNGTPASFTIDSSTQIRAQVPAGASSGPLSVVSPAGTGLSVEHFSVSASEPQQFTIAMTVSGSGTVTLDPPGGTYPAGTVVSLFAQAAEGWVFSGWDADLSGTSNPASLSMDGIKNVTATFTAQSSGGGGAVIHQQTVTGGAEQAQSVQTASGISGSAGDLYLAAISSRNSMAVSSVSGLGLSWSRVLRQCAGRNQTMIEVWMAQGAQAASGPVSAQFSSAFTSATISVSRYSGVYPDSPIVSLVAGNTMGADGLCSGGTDSASYAFNLNTSGDGGVIYTAVSMRHRAHQPGAGFVERAEVHTGSGGGVSSVAIQERSITTSGTVLINGAFSGTVDWAMIGLALRPAP